ncbi:MAG: hypothetical protein QME66_03120 [Candidatus Eisenbacteria bacterium]|nr:hypothetical protein [Candidatus Eisenbacteria bacterium]
MRRVSIPFFILAVCFTLGWMGYFVRPFTHFLAVLSALIFYFSSGIPWARLSGKLRLGYFVIPLLVLLAGGTGVPGLFFIALGVSTLFLIGVSRRVGRESAELVSLLTLLAFLAFGRIVTDEFPTAYYYLDKASESFSKSVGSLCGAEYLFGPISTGFGIFLSFLVFSILFLRSTKSGGLVRAVGYFFLYAITACFGLMILDPIAIFIKQRFPSLDLIYLNPQLIYFALYLLPLCVVLARDDCLAGQEAVSRASVQGSETSEANTPERFIPKGWFSKKTAVVFVLLLVLSTIVSLPDFERDGPKRVVLFDYGYLNWRTPDFTSFGGKSGGMFGNLPTFLKVTGYGPEKGDKLDKEHLRGAGCLVVINLIRYFNESEKKAILDYVRDGGSLLLLGDHTGVMGIRGPFNDLLGPTGIRFNFDSASFFSQGWTDALRLWPNPANKNLTSDDELQIWVGASLSVKPPARYQTVAMYGYADLGDPSNFGTAFLGDRKHNPGEKLGDIPLVAWTKFGKGKILVYGDTSPFQNGALVTAHAYVQRVFGWLTHRRTVDLFPFKVVSIVLISILALALLSPKALLGAGLLASLAFGQLVGRAVTRDYATGETAPNLALIDIGHANRFDQLGWYDNSVGGLEYNIMRNGLLPFTVEKLSKEKLGRAKLLVVVAPARKYSNGEIDAVEEFVRGGGRLLMAVGYEESEPSRELLSRFGIEILGIPLAHLETEVSGETIQFNEAWPVHCDGKCKSVVSKWGYPVVVEKNAGRGRLVVIGDSGFLLGKNLEKYSEVNVNNIFFLKRLMEELARER